MGGMALAQACASKRQTAQSLADRQRGTAVLQDLTPEQMEEMMQQAMDAAGEQEGQEIKMEMQPQDSSPSPGEG